MTLLAWSGIFIIALTALVKGAELFIDTSVRIGQALKMPAFLIGVLLVGFGTSLPELVSSVLAVAAGSSEIVVGNVLGSNITNILLVLGIAGILGGTFYIRTDLLKFDLPVMAGSAFVLALMISDGNFSTGEGIVSLLMFVVYMSVVLSSGTEDPGADNANKTTASVSALTVRTWVVLVASTAMIFFGAKYTVDAVVAASQIMAIGAEVIAMSAVAFGTSLPEVVVAVTAARRGQPEIVVGNIIGSNIFNTFAVMGVPALIGHLAIPSAVVVFSLPVFVAVTLVHVIMTVDRRVTRGEGAFLVAFYLFFLGRLLAWI